MQLNGEIFREYDIRGLVGKDLDENALELLGKGIGSFLLEKSGKKICVGHDNRDSSPGFAKALAKGLLSAGCNVAMIGLSTTPMLYFAVCKGKLDGGVMVTASHNPVEFNGLKVTEKNAFPVFGASLQEIRKIIGEKKFESGKGKLSRKKILPDYMKMLAKKIRLPKKRKLKVVVDTGNGVGGIVAGKILRKWGCRVIEQHTELDSSFPHHLPDPTVEENVKDLCERVVKEKADLGLGFDGDADRLGVVTGSGKMVFADKILALLARDFLARNKGQKVIGDVKCSRLFEDVVEKAGGKAVLWKTGHSLVKAKMRDEKILLAGEMSGHIFFGDEFFGFDDGVYAGGRLLRILCSQEKSLDELVGEMPVYFNTPEIRVDCPEESKGRIVGEVKDFFLKKYPGSVTIDGIRVVFEDGWALVRKSNTQPKLILRFEADSVKALENIKKTVVEKLSEYSELKGLDSVI